MIMARIFGARSAAMNMCSVRHSPMPSAPYSCAVRASSGVSAFARTRSRRCSSAQRRTVRNSSVHSGADNGTSSVVTSPVVPLMAILSPSRSTVEFTLTSRAARSISRLAAPDTQGRPMPLATSAAWLALPPSDVRMPRAAKNPATSAASVKGLTSTTSRPSSAAATASSAEKTISPLAAPGEAFTPQASTPYSASRSNVSCRSDSRLPASIVQSASPLSSRPSSTASTAKRTAAWAGRLAVRV
jgi:hypothetical protein